MASSNAAPAWEPACMEPDELAAWRSGRVAACDDCPLGFAASMREIGRCNGVPAGTEEEESIVSVARLTVSAPPCDTCAHAPVCRLREQVVDLSRFTVSAPSDGPELDRALTVVATATVECAYYQRAGRASVATKRTRNISPEGRERMRLSGIAAGERRRAKLAALSLEQPVPA